MDYLELKSKVQKLNVQYESDKTLLESRKQRLIEIQKETETVLKSLALTQEVAAEVQSQLSVKIDNVVNLALEILFPEYTFELQYIPSRGKTEVRFVFKSGDNEVDIMNQNGGGMVDVACFALRVAVYSLSNTDNVIILDEPFKYISRTLRPRIAELLSALSDKMGMQFIYVTHIDELSDNANKKFIVKKINGVSEIS